MSDCVFCNILSGTSPGSIVCRDELCTVLMDIQPINPGHMLVIPNTHATSLGDLDSETAAHLFRVGQRLARALRGSGVRCEGVNLFVADGEAAGQEVFHVHLHVFPRYRGDGFGLRFPPTYRNRPPRADLDQIASQIRTVLES